MNPEAVRVRYYRYDGIDNISADELSEYNTLNEQSDMVSKEAAFINYTGKYAY